MKTSQINVEVANTVDGDTISVEIAPTVATPQPSMKVGIDSNVKVMLSADKIPSNWKITVIDDNDKIEANNLETRSVFSGTIAEFNKLLKG